MTDKKPPREKGLSSNTAIVDLPDRMIREKAAAMGAEGKKAAAAHYTDSRTQSERFIAKARELGLDEREEVFDAALTKVARHTPAEADAPKRRDR